jgi:hypothetical protein
MKKFFSFSVKLFIILFFFFSLFYSKIANAQRHPLAGEKEYRLYFMKNLTTDDQTDYSNDTCSVFETTLNNLPDIWVRAFFDKNLQDYIDYFKKKHSKILRINTVLNYHIDKLLYKNGKITGSHDGHAKYEQRNEWVKSENIDNNYVNTIMFKLNDFENFVKNVNFECSKEKGVTTMLIIAMHLQIGCTYVDILEREKVDFIQQFCCGTGCDNKLWGVPGGPLIIIVKN